MSAFLPYWLLALYLQWTPRKFMRWFAAFKENNRDATIKDFFTASTNDLLAIGLTTEEVAAIQTPRWHDVEKDLAWAAVTNQHILALDDADYPSLLKEIADPPLVLFVQGNKQALYKRQIAIVGARKASPAGIKNAEQFAQQLCAADFAITSGMALGIDAAAHQGALSVAGTTIGVAGTGLHHIYPAAHRKLVATIIEKTGAVVSEFSLSTGPTPFNFPRRNRVIAGLSCGVLVVEAALKSGSLSTANHANEQGREVFAIPGSIHHALSRGCHHLIRQGATLVESAADIIASLGVLSTFVSSHHTDKKPDLAPEYCQLLAHIEHEMTPIDVIISRSTLTAAAVSSMLLTLELNGYVAAVPGGYIRTAPN